MEADHPADLDLATAAAHLQPEMLATRDWDEPTGSGINSQSGVTSRVETDDNANWTKDGDDRSPSLLSYESRRLQPEVTSDATGSHVFSDVDYHVLRRHVMQGDPDDHVVAGDRKSLDGRKLVLGFFGESLPRFILIMMMIIIIIIIKWQFINGAITRRESLYRAATCVTM